MFETVLDAHGAFEPGESQLQRVWLLAEGESEPTGDGMMVHSAWADKQAIFDESIYEDGFFFPCLFVRHVFVDATKCSEVDHQEEARI